MPAIDTVNRVFREFERYTGDGRPNPPPGAILPVGDPESGPHSPKKSELREALLAVLLEAGANIDAAQAILDDLMGRYIGAYGDDEAASAASGTPVVGRLYFNTTVGKFRVWTGVAWQDQSVALSDGEVTDAKIAPSSKLSNRINSHVDVRDFGAVPDDDGFAGSDSTAAIQAAIAFAITNKIGEVYVPGPYRITDTLVVNTSAFTQAIKIRGDGGISRIRQTGAGKDAIRWSTTQFLKNSGMEDISILCMPTAGHGVNIKFGCVLNHFKNVNVTVLNTAKSCWYGDYSGFTVGDGGVYDTVWEGGDWELDGAGGATAPGFRFVTNGTTFNENIIRNARPYNAGLVQFFLIGNIHATSYLTNNKFQNLNFEKCKGGGFYLESATGFAFENISFWDVATYNNHLFHFAAGVGYDSYANSINGLKRHAGVRASGVYDILLSAANDTLVMNLGTTVADGAAYNWNNKRVTVVGGAVSGEVNTTQRERFGSLNAMHDAYVATARVDSLRVGGFSTTEGATVSYGGGFTQVINSLASSGIKMAAKNGSNQERSMFLSATALFPLPDNTLNLGDNGSRWAVVWAGTATISTSDEEEKQDIEPIPNEWLDAWGDVQFSRFRFRDAVEQKGGDARWHVGVIAQRVEAAFKKRGINAFEIGLLCFDKWDAREAVTADDGTEVLPARAAGQRYGVRYEEALVLEAAYQRRETYLLKQKLQN